MHTLAGPEAQDALDTNQTKPAFVSKRVHFSISHSEDWVAVALHPTQHIGVDIQTYQTKLLRVLTKFLSAEELRVYQSASLVALTVLWAIKESVYKLYGQSISAYADSIQLITPQEISEVEDLVQMFRVRYQNASYETQCVAYVCVYPQFTLAYALPL